MIEDDQQEDIDSTGISTSMNGVRDSVINITHFRPLSPRETLVFTYGGLGFLMASLSCLAFMLILLNNVDLPSAPSIQSTGEVKADYFALTQLYLSIALRPLVVFGAAILCALMGYFLLRAAGTSVKEVIPVSEFSLISQLLVNEKQVGIDNYIRLSSLSGFTGFFTKIGLSGLPLATIGLTLIFTAFYAVGGEPFIDLAKLTLGAFLGSYVQRRAQGKTSIEDV